MKKITTILVLTLFTVSTTFAQLARVQVIHNSPDAAAAQVDVYLNGLLLLNDFAFRTATPFVDVPAGIALSIDIAPASSASVAESIYNLSTTLMSNETYILVADGIVSQIGTTAPNFTISVFASGREMATNAMQTDVLVNHGSPDAPTVDVVETSVPAGTVVDNISFPDFAGYLELPTLDFTLDVRDATGAVTVASYTAPLQTLGLEGAAITVLASGFLDPSVGTDLPAFGLWVATAAGGDLIPLPTASARVQVIHNSPDPAAAQVDVYLNGMLLLDNFAFRTATPFVDAPAGTPVSIDIAPATSTSVSESIYNLTTTLTNGQTYIVVADGIVSQIGTTAPNFTLSVFAPGREMATDPMQTDVLVNHGSPDAPTVDVVETSVPAGTVVDNISFPDFAGYLELPTLDFTLDVRDETGTVTVASYSAPLQTLGLEGAAITVLASGFLDPSVGTDLPAFGLWVATAAGGALIPLPTASLSRSNFDSNAFGVYPNPAKGKLSILNTNNVDINKATIIDLNGRVVKEIKSGFDNINVSNLTRGMYLMSIESGKSVVNKKIIINN